MKVEGFGVVSALGVGVEATVANIRAGQRFELARDEDFHGALLARVSLTTKELYRRAAPKRPSACYSRAELLALFAIKEAMRSCTFDFAGCSGRIGLYCGTSLASTDELEQSYEVFCATDAFDSRRLRAGDFSSILDTLAHELNALGPRAIVSNACSSSIAVLDLAEADLRTGQAEVAIVFGVDPLTRLSVLGFGSLQALAKVRPAPFSAGEMGLVLGEGAGCLILSTAPTGDGHAISLEAVGVSADAYHPTAPDPEGKGMRAAMAQALRGDTDVDLVIAHGTGTELNDKAESTALQCTFGARADRPYVVSTKAATGHTLGAAGALNSAIACIALAHDLVPPSFNYETPRAGCDLNIPREARSTPVRRVLANSFGFGGNNASAVFSKRSVEHQPLAPRRVFITHAGMLTGYGIGLAKNCVAFEDGQGSRPLRIGDDVLVEQTARLRYGRRMDRFSQLALIAADDLRSSMREASTSFDATRSALFSGNGLPPLNCLQKFYQGYLKNGPRRVVPSLFTNTVSNACIGYMALEWGWNGPAFAIPQFSLASAAALHAAAQYLWTHPNASTAVAGGLDEYCENAQLVLRHYGLTVEDGAPRGLPFSGSARGLNAAEGAGYFLLEASDSVPAHAVAELTTSRMGADASHPHSYPRRWPHLAAEVAKRGALHVPDLVIVNGSGVPRLDGPLRAALSSVLPEQTPLYSPLAAFGNAPGMNGFLGALAGSYALKRQRLPFGTLTLGSDQLRLDTPDIVTVLVITAKHGGTFNIMELTCAS